VVVPIRPIDGDIDLALARVGHDAVRVVPGRAVEGHGEGGAAPDPRLFFRLPPWPGSWSTPGQTGARLGSAVFKISLARLKGERARSEMQTGQPLPDPVRTTAGQLGLQGQYRSQPGPCEGHSRAPSSRIFRRLHGGGKIGRLARVSLQGVGSSRWHEPWRRFSPPARAAAQRLAVLAISVARVVDRHS
jgi:hypothetical protein